MSERSLRRRLTPEGATWRSILNDVKFACAEERLKRGVPVREDAQQLGYSDSAHFTRFFQGRTGVAPSQWREHVESARELVDKARSFYRPRSRRGR